MSSGWLPKHRQLLFQIFEEGPKVPAPPDPYDLQRKSSFYLDERNGQMRAKRLAAEIELALTRGRPLHLPPHPRRRPIQKLTTCKMYSRV